jgi:hypothetical protein
MGNCGGVMGDTNSPVSDGVSSSQELHCAGEPGGPAAVASATPAPKNAAAASQITDHEECGTERRIRQSSVIVPETPQAKRRSFIIPETPPSDLARANPATTLSERMGDGVPLPGLVDIVDSAKHPILHRCCDART